MVNFSGDLELGAGDDSIESVRFAVGEQTKTISVNAFEGDNDFETTEEVEITAEVTQGVTELVVQPLTVTVSETVPVFSLIASSQEFWYRTQIRFASIYSWTMRRSLLARA